MKLTQAMTEDSIWELYRLSRFCTGEIVFSERGIEVPDEQTGLTFILPKDFYVFTDGQPIDPLKPYVDHVHCVPQIMMLEPAHHTFQYLFGYYNPRGEKSAEFRIADPLKDEKIPGILLMTEWDLRLSLPPLEIVTGVRDLDAHPQLVYHKKYAYDDYGVSGRECFILQPNPADVFFGVSPLWQARCGAAREWRKEMQVHIQEFEAHKAECKAEMLKTLEPLETRELWDMEPEEDWVILKHHYSPAAVKNYRFRYDSTGLVLCGRLMAEVLEFDLESVRQ